MKKVLVLGTSMVLALFAGIGYADQSSSTQDRSMKPETVQKAEQALNDKGYDAGPADGTFDSKTSSAVKSYQKAEGLKPTGMLDQQTLAKLGVSSEGSAAGGPSEGSKDKETKKSDEYKGEGAGGKKSDESKDKSTGSDNK